MFELRPYQQEAKDNVFYHWDVLKNKNVHGRPDGVHIRLVGVGDTLLA